MTARTATPTVVPPELRALAEQAQAYINSVPRPVFSSPAEVAEYLLPDTLVSEQEWLVALLLNTRNRLIEKHLVYLGSVNASLIRVSEVFRQAVRMNAAAVIIAHNHPSGDPAPSPEDVAVTKAMVEAGKLLDIEVLDHMVLGGGGYVSMKARHLGFE